MTLEKLLEKLPSSADGIAGYLLALGIKGKRLNHCSCPIANFINESKVTWSGIHVYSDKKNVWFMIEDAQILWMPIYGNRAMYDFVTGFDAGKYPELEA